MFQIKSLQCCLTLKPKHLNAFIGTRNGNHWHTEHLTTDNRNEKYTSKSSVALPQYVRNVVPEF